MRGSALSVAIIIVALAAVIGMVGFIFFKNSTTSTQSTAANTSPSGIPQATVKDFAPNLPMSQKTTILIELSDSSMEKYIVPKDQVATYIKNLPPGYHVVSQSP